MTTWCLGTMGFSYKDWEGVFYPAGTPARDYLAHYSQVFNAVELDSTFYGTPRVEVVQRWAAVTPDNFKFCAKTPREITHDLGLAAAEEPMLAFVDVMRHLGDKLGVILLQFSPDFTYAHFNTLAHFLRHLPRDASYAVEFRHSSWRTPGVGELLRHEGVAWAAADFFDQPRYLHVTADFLYIRWIGRHGRFPSHTSEQVDMTPRLQEWWPRLQKHLDEVHTIYGFFNNDYEGYAPATAARWKALVGLTAESSPPTPQQGKLFS